jgi:transcription initiation factor TFIID subunit 1
MAYDESPSFEEIDWQKQEQDDAREMQRVLDQSAEQGDNTLFSRELELGDKADDAEDFEDISDDDLPEEEPATGGNNHDDAPGLTDDMDMDVDALFDDDRETSPFDEQDGHEGLQANGIAQQPHMNGGLTFPSSELEELENLYDLNFNSSVPDVTVSLEDLIKIGYEKGAILKWNSLMPPVEEYLEPKQPLKTPKPVNPTKVSLDLAPDQEKSFRAAGPATGDKRKRVQEAEVKGLVAIVEESSDEGESDDGFDYTPPDPNEKIGGISWTDFEIAVTDFESKINPEVPEVEIQEEVQDEPMDEWDREFLGHPAHKKKVVREDKDFIMAPQYPVPNFDNFEQMTAHTAKRVVLDLNDPYLLVDIQEYKPAAKRQRLSRGYKRVGNGTFASTLSQRFNISNDEAYDALKENHQSKVRATLGNLTVEHSMPALKLQWPYYRVKLYTREARSFHRPSLKFNKFLNQPIYFSKPGFRKKKAVKGLSTGEIFKETRDLSLADHYSNATLFEYSEEHPTVLSNFGMGNRIINYYRRKDGDDTERPQPEDKIGDVTVLLPEDRSPFANFGMVDPGETVRTLHNSLYRAPIFKHEPQATDFLIIRSSTGVGGTSWHIRNIDNLFVVGQQFPSIEVPGPHSRKVTNAAKNRMRMIAYRKIRHSPQHQLKIGEITAHIIDSSDMQNRQKLKEFINYDKTEKVWRMKPGELIPEESQIRAMVKPEEVCLIDAMQVGARHLEDAGYAVQDEEEQAGDEEGQSLEQSLAPWKTTKAFMEASSDKAMLRLHGAGDPSGRGLAFSFIKTSMKGGYLEALQGPDSDLTPAMEAARAAAMDPKNNNGHGYNVKTQQKLYNDAIRVIWEAQKEDLSNTGVREQNDMQLEEQGEGAKSGVAQTPHSMATPAPHFDDNASIFSSGTQHQNRVLRIVRKVVNKFGQVDEVTEIVKDPAVQNQYLRRRRELDAEKSK